MVCIEIWHPINGEWFHFTQTAENGVRNYYTNGKHVMTQSVDENGCVISGEVV